MKVGLFGGTFDPIHLGHLRTVREVSERFGLTKTYLIPAALPPHKPHRVISPVEDRLAMMRLAVEHLETFEISDIELHRTGPSYTIDTLKQFQGAPGAADKTYHLIMGLDTFLEIDTWKAYLDIFKLVPVIIMARPGKPYAPMASPWQQVTDFVRHHISSGYRITDAGAFSSNDEFQPIHFMEVSLLDISGTRIRDLIREGKSIQFLVPEKVERYIHQQGLYQ
jgi:nicotinate-nucleotide adenylyltransferase